MTSIASSTRGPSVALLDVGDVLLFDLPVQLAYSWKLACRLKAALGVIPCSPLRLARLSRSDQIDGVASEQLCQYVDDAWGEVRAEWQELAQPIPMALDAVRDLHANGWRLAVVANQPPETMTTLDLLDLSELFELVLLDSLCGVSKPTPEIFLQAIRSMRISAGDAVMIGDRIDNDVAPAKQLGIATMLIKNVHLACSASPAYVPWSWRARYIRDRYPEHEGTSRTSRRPRPFEPDMEAESLRSAVDVLTTQIN